MKNWKLFSANKYVSKYVECYWFLQKEANDKGSEHPKLYPDPSAHLLIAKSDYQYQYQSESQIFSGLGSHVIYPSRHTYLMDHSKPFWVMGIKLKIGALYSLNTHLDPNKLNQVIMLDLPNLLALNNFDADTFLVECLTEPESIITILDKHLFQWIVDCREDRSSELVRKVLPLLNTASLGELGHLLYCSQRTVERSFLKVTGFTLKQCQSMLRFETILEYLHEKDINHIDWMSVAFEFGFSDQPHLIRHLKETIGATPSQYAQQRDLTIDVYGNFEFD